MKKIALKEREVPKASIEYSNKIQHVYKHIEKYYPDRNRKVLIVFDDKIADMISQKKHNQIVTELSIRGWKLSISNLFITKSQFAVPKDVRLNCTHLFKLLKLFVKIPDKKELQQIAFNNSADIDSKYFLNLYKRCTSKT